MNLLHQKLSPEQNKSSYMQLNSLKVKTSPVAKVTKTDNATSFIKDLTLSIKEFISPENASSQPETYGFNNATRAQLWTVRYYTSSSLVYLYCIFSASN